MARTKNYYVVIKGKQNYCIFTRWTDCAFCVKGVSGAKYKGFETGAEAIAYLEGMKNGFVNTSYVQSKIRKINDYVNTYNTDNPYTKYKNKVNNNNSSNNNTNSSRNNSKKEEGIYDNINSVQFKYKQLQNKNLNISKTSYEEQKEKLLQEEEIDDFQ